MKKIIGLTLFCMAYLVHADNPYQLYMLANYSAFGQKPDVLTMYEKLLPMAGSLHPYRGLIPYLFSINQFGPIVALIPKLETAFADDLDMQLMFAQSLAYTGQEALAEQRFIDLQQKHKKNPELTYLAAVAYSKANPQKSIIVIEEYLNAVPLQPRNCIFLFLESQLYLSLNNKPKAIEKVKKCIELCPRFDKGWLLLGLVHEQAGKINEAIQGYSTFLELAGPHKEVESQLKRLMIQKKAGTDQNTAPEPQYTPCTTSALVMYEKGQWEQALGALNSCLKQSPDDQESRLLKINILSAMDRIPEAVNELQQWMLQEPTKDIWYQTLHLLYRAGLKAQTVIDVLQTVEKKHPSTLAPLLYLADMYTRIEDFTTALSYHTKALNFTNDLALKTKILCNMGMIYYQREEYTSMKQVLEQAQKMDPTFAPALNLLAYYYATKGGNLTLANQLIKTALEHDKNNPHFLDTQALILYKQHEYTKALALLKKLVRQVPNDYYINLHLGQAYCKTGNTQDGINAFKKAVNLAKTKQEATKARSLIEYWH